jgi:hypothetical protein
MKIVVIIWVMFCGAMAASAATNATMVSNFAQPATGILSFGDFSGQSFQVASAFKTDDTPGNLAVVSIIFFDAYVPSNAPGPYQLSIYSDVGGKPGNILATNFSGENYPTNWRTYSFTNTTPLTLLPNTTYWIVSSSPGSVGTGVSYRLADAPTNTADPGSFWKVGDHSAYKLGSDPWVLYFPSSSTEFFSITAKPLPPPMAIAAGTGAQTNFTALSNIGQSTGSAATVGPGSPTAISFMTGSTEALLSAVDVSMQVPSPAPGTFQPFSLSLYDDASGSPGSSLAVLSGNSYPTNTAVYTYTQASPLKLSANTRYWIVESAAASSRPYSWNLNTSGTVDSGSTWALGQMKANFGSGWALESGFYPKFSMRVSAPTFVLTFPTPDFPYALRQNSNPATANWVNVTNSVSTSVVSNRTVLLVPPVGPQLFYRLDLP